MNPYPSVIVCDVAGVVPTVPVNDKKKINNDIENGWLFVNSKDRKVYTRSGDQIIDITPAAFNLAAAIHASIPYSTLNPGDEFVFWNYVTGLSSKINVADITINAVALLNGIYFPLGGDLITLSTTEMNQNFVLIPDGLGGVMWSTRDTIPEVFTSTAGQTAFPTTFQATSYTKVYEMGIRSFYPQWVPIMGVVTFAVGRPDGTEIAIQER